MPKNVTRSEAAQRDLEEQVDYFDERSSELAQRYLNAVIKTFDFLAANREAGQLCHFENPVTEGLRAWPIENFRNYLVFFRPRMTALSSNEYFTVRETLIHYFVVEAN